MKKIFALFFILINVLLNVSAPHASAQGVGVNLSGNDPASSAGLDIDFANRGLLIPRVNLSSDTDVSTILSPATYLTVFNVNASMVNGNGVGMYYWNGNNWAYMAAASNGPGASGQVLTSSGAGSPPSWTTPATGTVTSISAGTPGTNTAGSGLTFSANPISNTGSVALSNTAVTPGSYTMASVTVDQQGRITAASSGSGGAGMLSCTDVSGTQAHTSVAACPSGYTITGGWYDHRDYNVASSGAFVTGTISGNTFTAYDSNVSNYYVVAHARCCKIE